MLLACLSAGAPAVKELLLARLDSPLEDIRVKVGHFQITMPPLVSVLAQPPAASSAKELVVMGLDSPLKDIMVKKGNICAPCRQC